jgi:RNA polymerase sigma factor (sigma-70 family)
MARLPAPLIQSAIAGDHAALLGLLEAARPDIRRYARAACRANDVDDAVQETLWLLYRRVGTLRVVTSFSAWLFAIVRRECLRLARTFAATDDLTEEHAVLAQPDEALRLDLAKAIQSLPTHYRTIVVMRDMEERTVGEIADALGVTRETVKARLHRARILLREYLLR